VQYNGSIWVNATPSSGGATTLDGLTDVTITTAASGQVLQYNGSLWVNTTPKANWADRSADDLTSIALGTALTTFVRKTDIAANFTIATTGTAAAGDMLLLDIDTDGTARTITFPSGSEMQFGVSTAVVIPINTRYKFTMLWDGTRWTVNFSSYA
jgi:hypothetical protein